jgi:phenylalanyl-tRNA synthetase beta subunit
MINDTWVGCFGEIDPSVAMNYELRVPINGAEIDVTALVNLLEDPV